MLTLEVATSSVAGGSLTPGSVAGAPPQALARTQDVAPDVLQDLGVDAIWLSPVFPSPMRDFGYDVSEYCDIDPLFGDLAAFDALVDYGGTLVFVSHDRYFVDRLATKIVEVDDGKALLYPGGYEEFLWSKENAAAPARPSAPIAPNARRAPGATGAPSAPRAPSAPSAPSPVQSYEERKRDLAEQRKREKAFKSLKNRIDDLETRIADRDKQIKDVEAAMAAPGFYEDHEKSKPIIDRHQALMYEIGDLMHQWEEVEGKRM